MPLSDAHLVCTNQKGDRMNGIRLLWLVGALTSGANLWLRYRSAKEQAENVGQAERVLELAKILKRTR